MWPSTCSGFPARSELAQAHVLFWRSPHGCKVKRIDARARPHPSRRRLLRFLRMTWRLLKGRIHYEECYYGRICHRNPRKHVRVTARVAGSFNAPARVQPTKKPQRHPEAAARLRGPRRMAACAVGRCGGCHPSRLAQRRSLEHREREPAVPAAKLRLHYRVFGPRRVRPADQQVLASGRRLILL
jgi:hypothetical protein